MIKLRKFVFIVVVLITATLLVACNPSDNDNFDSNIVTSIYVEGGKIFVKYLDDSVREVGVPEKIDSLNGITKVSLGSRAEVLVEYANGEVTDFGVIVGSSNQQVEFELKNNFLRWRFVGSNSSYQNLISIGLLSSQELRNDLNVVFSIENNQIRWKDIDDNSWNSLLGYLTLGSILGLSDITIKSVIIDDDNNAVVTFADNTTYTLNLPFEYHTVTVKDEDGDVVETYKVASGFSLGLPELEERAGYSANYDYEGAPITNDLVVNIIYIPNQFVINFDYPNIEYRGQNYGEPISGLPIPVKEGFEFVRWELSDGTIINNGMIFEFSSNITLIPVFVINPTETYQVKVYKENANNDYDLVNSFTVLSNLGDEVSPQLPIIDGYHLNIDLSVTTGVVLESGLLTLEFYMDPNSYTISFDTSTLDFSLDPSFDPDLDDPEDPVEDPNLDINDIVVLYDRKIDNLPLVYKEDYVFIGWEDSSGNLLVIGDDFNYLENITLSPKFEEGVEYIVQYYHFSHHNMSYNQSRVEYKVGKVGEVVEALVDAPYGFEVDLDHNLLNLSSIVSKGINTVLRVYYKYANFNVTYLDHNDQVLKSSEQPYLSQAANYTNWERRPGYNFVGWFDENDALIPFGTLVGEDMTLKVKYANADVGYRVNHVLLGSDGVLENVIDTIVENFTTTSFTEFEAIPIEIEGYTLYRSPSIFNGTTGADHYQSNATIYYTQNKYYVEFEYLNEENVITHLLTLSGVYDELLDLPDANPKPGKEFVGWYLDDKLVENFRFGSTNQIIKLLAKYEDEQEEKALYYINYYFEKPDGGFLLKARQGFLGVVGEETELIMIDELTHLGPDFIPTVHEFDENNPLNVLEDIIIANTIVEHVGTISTELDVYYKYKEYRVTYFFSDQEIYYGYKYNTVVNIGSVMTELMPIVEEDLHLTFEGWVLSHSNEPQKIIANHTLTEDIDVYGIFSDYVYTITLKDGLNETEIHTTAGQSINLPILANEYDVENDTSHQFLGWMNEDNSDHLTNFVFDYDDHITLYAKWHSTGRLYKTISGVRIGHVILLKYVGRNINETIPEVIDGKPVEGVWTRAFHEDGYVQHLTLTPLVYQFGSLTGMQRLKTVNYNGDLSKVVIMGDGALRSNPNLEYVDFSNANMIWRKGIFSHTPKLSEVKFPIGLTEIPEQTFWNSGISNVVIPETVTKIGEMAFFGSKIVDIIIPSSVTLIERNAFATSTLESVVIANDALVELNDRSFGVETNNVLEYIVIPNSAILIAGTNPVITANEINLFVDKDIIPLEFSTNQNVYIRGEWEYNSQGKPVPIAN